MTLPSSQLKIWRSFNSSLALLTSFIADKPLLVLKSLKKAKALDATDPKMHVVAVKFLLSLPALKLHPVVDSVLKEEVAELFGGKDAAALNSAFIEQHPKSLPHLIAGL